MLELVLELEFVDWEGPSGTEAELGGDTIDACMDDFQGMLGKNGLFACIGIGIVVVSIARIPPTPARVVKDPFRSRPNIPSFPNENDIAAPDEPSALSPPKPPAGAAGPVAVAVGVVLPALSPTPTPIPTPAGPAAISSNPLELLSISILLSFGKSTGHL